MTSRLNNNITMPRIPERPYLEPKVPQGPSLNGQTAQNMGGYPEQSQHRLLQLPTMNASPTQGHGQLSDPLKAQLASQRAMGLAGAAKQDRQSNLSTVTAGALAVGAGAVAVSRSAAFEVGKNTLGVAGAGKYSYQAVRAAQGLATTTKATVALDLLGGSLGMGSAASAEAASVGIDAAKGLATEAKGLAGAGKLSGMAKISNVASKAAPVIAKGAAVVGVGLGAYGIYDGVQELRSGNQEKGREKIVSGSADVVTSAALGVAAISSGTVVGLPVAAVALGVAGVSQAAKYAYKFSDEIASGASWLANKVGGWWN